MQMSRDSFPTDWSPPPVEFLKKSKKVLQAHRRPPEDMEKEHPDSDQKVELASLEELFWNMAGPSQQAVTPEVSKPTALGFPPCPLPLVSHEPVLSDHPFHCRALTPLVYTATPSLAPWSRFLIIYWSLAYGLDHILYFSPALGSHSWECGPQARSTPPVFLLLALATEGQGVAADPVSFVHGAPQGFCAKAEGLA